MLSPNFFMIKNKQANVLLTAVLLFYRKIEEGVTEAKGHSKAMKYKKTFYLIWDEEESLACFDRPNTQYVDLDEEFSPPVQIIYQRKDDESLQNQ